MVFILVFPWVVRISTQSFFLSPLTETENRMTNNAQADYGYKDQCLKLEDVHRTGTVDSTAAVPCRRSHSCMRVVVDPDKGHQRSH